MLRLPHTATVPGPGAPLSTGARSLAPIRTRKRPTLRAGRESSSRSVSGRSARSIKERYLHDDDLLLGILHEERFPADRNRRRTCRIPCPTDDVNVACDVSSPHPSADSSVSGCATRSVFRTGGNTRTPAHPCQGKREHLRLHRRFPTPRAADMTMAGHNRHSIIVTPLNERAASDGTNRCLALA